MINLATCILVIQSSPHIQRINIDGYTITSRKPTNVYRCDNVDKPQTKPLVVDYSRPLRQFKRRVR